MPIKKRTIDVVPIEIKKNDKVEVIAGKEKGKTGKVLKVLRDRNSVLVEKLNMIKRHTRPSPTSGQGGIVEKEAPLHISNVLLICGKCTEATRIKKTQTGEGKWVRACKKCGELID
ncbi:MAG: 50S ribosomal protein L24 [Deltaproteobacteria bacterium]|nr:50S ribosomal protein L24 [Deltaproteobacteria bacterium]